MTAVIRCRGLAGTTVDHTPPPPDGAYLASFDPEYAGGRGYAAWTTDPAKAMRFETVLEAFDYWRQPSRVRPVRDDGLPNRPLCAYSVEVGEAP